MKKPVGISCPMYGAKKAEDKYEDLTPEQVEQFELMRAQIYRETMLNRPSPDFISSVLDGKESRVLSLKIGWRSKN